MSTDQLAFVGAEGYGANTSGGRGGSIITVTNLNDSGVGSLRWALEQNSGPRTVVFAVNGTIHLDSQIMIQNGDVTIAGQTSAGDGITVEGARIRVKADNVIVRGMHFRPGDSANGQDGGDRDGIMVGTTDFQLKNVIIDHNSFEWATDENVDIQGHVTNITVSNNIIASGLSHSINPEGEHSKGLLISNWSSTDSAYDTNISVIKNLFANNMDRNPEVRAGQNIEIINNYTYDAGYGQHTIAVGAGNNGTLVTTVAVVGNVVEAGKSTQKNAAPVALSAMADGSGVYISDNVWTKLTADAQGNNSQAALTGNLGGGQYASATAIFAGSKVNILDSTQVKAYVLANVGANAGHWDAIDQAVLNGVVNGTGTIIDSVAQAGGPQAQVAVQAAVDTDKDGMPNWFEDLYGFNSKVADNNGDIDHDGYTNIEEYINGLISGFDLPLAKTVVVTNAVDGKADTFIMNTATLATPMAINGFNAAEGDRLDLSSLLTSYRPGIDKLTDFVNLTVVDGAGVLTIDRDGTGSAYVAQVLATISNGSGLVLSNTIKGATTTDDYTGIAATASAAINAGNPNATTTTTTVTTSTGTYATVNGTSQMETLTGSAAADHLLGLGGNDTLYGGAGNDWLEGGEGSDTLDGGTGADILTGGNGNDTYVVDNVGDTVTEAPNAGTDEVRSSITYVLGANLENLTLTGADAVNGTGNGLNNIVTGNDGANTLYGGDGNDTVYGGAGNDTLYGGAGSDTMKGGLGDDTYYVESTADTVTENFNEGTDTVRSSVSFTLGSNIEKLIFTGTGAFTGTGNTSDNTIVGGAGPNTLSGLAGNDTLVGGAGNDTLDGGTGIDTMTGGAGNDSYVVDNAGDTVNELDGGGNDTVTTSVGWTLTAGSAVETIIALAGTTAINLTGNELANTLIGNAGKNVLDGGAGADTMSGGAGDDTYVVDNAGDVVNEAAAGGTDTVRTTLLNYSLGDNVENLTFIGTGDFHGTGNALNNIITGGSGNNVLDGGTGADTLVGGAGNDTYIVDNAGDKITELAGGGNDTILTSVASYSMAAEVEAMTYTGAGTFSGSGNASDNTITGGVQADSLSGMAGNDRLYGLAGVDSLSGGDGNDFLVGGAGADKMAGGAGADTFVYGSAAEGGDTITDFDTTMDHIQLSASGFGISSVANLHFFSSATNPVATTAGPALLYNTKTGAIYFDDDGSGSHAAVLLATLSTHPAFDLTDIIVGP
jgi:Ca2+-binding RTX toxin-like protein